MRPTALWILVAATGSACSPCETACAELEGTALSLTLGTGESAFEPLEDGARLPIVVGPQLGYHVVVALQGTGFLAGDVTDRSGPCSPEVDLALATDDGELHDAWSVQPIVFTALGDTRVAVNQFLVLDLVADPDEADGKMATIDVTLTDACGHSATDTRRVELAYTPPVET